MYRLSRDVDIAFLINIQLLQVCIGVNEAILNFDKNVRLTMLSDFLIETPGASPQPYEEPVRAAPVLCTLLHDTVTSASATEQGGLVLTFKSGSRLTVLDTSEQYESFWIEAPGKRIIV